MPSQALNAQAHEIEVFIPEDHRLTIQVPRTVRSGRAKVIFAPIPEADEASSTNDGRLARFVQELDREDPRPFQELDREQRRARLMRLRGVAKGLTSGSEALARQKQKEIEIEERKFGR